MCTTPGGVAYVLMPLFTVGRSVWIFVTYLALIAPGMVKRLSPGVSCPFRLPAFRVGASVASRPWVIRVCVVPCDILLFFFWSYFPSFVCLYVCINSMQLLFVFYYVSLDVFASGGMGYVRWFA